MLYLIQLKMLKSKLMPTVVLSAICVCVVAILAVVNVFTSPAIQANQDAKAQKALLSTPPPSSSTAPEPALCKLG